jgi:hypothetical protein
VDGFLPLCRGPAVAVVAVAVGFVGGRDCGVLFVVPAAVAAAAVVVVVGDDSAERKAIAAPDVVHGVVPGAAQGQ